MRQPRITIILLSCFFSLIVGSRSSIFAQQQPQTPEKERGIELYRKENFSEAVEALKKAVKSTFGGPDQTMSLPGAKPPLLHAASLSVGRALMDFPTFFSAVRSS